MPSVVKLRFSRERSSDRVRRNGTFGFRMYTTIYAIDAPEVDRIKFGITGNIKRRFAGLCNASPTRLILLGHIWMPEETEAHIFEYLKQDRSHGEWFMRTESSRSIAALIAAGFDKHLAEVIGLTETIPADCDRRLNPDYDPIRDLPSEKYLAD